MRYTCKYNPDIDLQPTVCGLETDLKLAIESGVVMNTGLNCFYNEIDDPANIRGKVSDVFDAIIAQKAILSSGKVQPASTVEPAQSTSQDS